MNNLIHSANSYCRAVHITGGQGHSTNELITTSDTRELLREARKERCGRWGLSSGFCLSHKFKQEKSSDKISAFGI